MSRRFPILIAVALLMAIAIPAAAKGPADKATGSGYWETGSEVQYYAEFNAHQGLNGRPAKGYLLQERVDGTGGFTVDVTDVVVGERAGKKFACFGGLTEAWGVLSFGQGLFRWTIVVDGGEPGVGVDGIKGNFLAPGSELPGPCRRGQAARWDLTGGNIQVHFGGPQA